MIELPTGLQRGLRSVEDGGRAWVEQLPARIDRLQRRWGLDLGPPFEPGGVTSWVAPAMLPDGTEAVLKVVVPHPEAAHEAEALEAWGGDGAVRLLDHVPEDHALLLERCRPALALRDAGRADEEVLEVGAALAARLWRPVPAEAPFLPLLDRTTDWADVAEEELTSTALPIPEGLARDGVGLLRELPPGSDRDVLLHGDLHPGNVLAAGREPWLAIDPKPVSGDPAFDLPSLVLQTGDLLAAVDPRAELARRLDRVAAVASVDRERIRLWGLARCVEMTVSAAAAGDETALPEAPAWARLLADTPS